MSPLGDSDPTRGHDVPGEPTQWIGPYHLLQKIGEGGMGEVWVAEQHEPIRRTVALKVIKLGMDTRQVVARFEAERQALAVMEHPAIAKVLDAGTTASGRPYFVMEYVKGERITDYCDRQRLSTADRLALFVKVCEGVQHAHQKGIIHRDLKPSNVLVAIQDGQPVPKIIDFGIAKATAHHLTEQTVFTELGLLIGTPEYMSPEQAEMTGLDIDTRTDIYSLGVLLYELLTGTLPFDREALRERALDEIRRTIREVDPPKPSTRVTQMGPALTEAARKRLTEPARLAGQLRGDLDWITMRALEKDRTRRYDTAMGFANDLRRHLANEPVSAGPPGAAYRAGKFVRRHRFGVATAAALVLLLVGFSVTMAVQARRIARERDRAVAAEKTATQVSAFLVDLFRISDPTGTKGATVTAREILDRGAGQVDRDLRSQPLVQASLMDTLGRVYDSLGLFDRAQPLLEASLATRRRLLGAEHLDVAASLVANGTFWFHKGDFDRSEPMQKQALAIRERLLGPEAPEVAASLNNLGTLNLGRGRYDEAQRLMERALQIQERTLPPDAPELATSVNTLGAIAYRRSDRARARELWERTLAMRERTFGPEHPYVAQTLNNLALLHNQAGDAAGARPLLERVVAIQEKTLGPKHPDLAFALNNLGDALLTLREYTAARATYQRAVSILEPANPDHPELARIFIGLSRASLELGDTRAARQCCERSLGIGEKVYGKGHPETAGSLVCLANCDRFEEKYAPAEALFEQALALLRRPDGQLDPAASWWLSDYAELMRATGRGARAAELDATVRALMKAQ